MPIFGRKGAEWERVRAQVLSGATVCQMPNCMYPGVSLSLESKVKGRPGPLYPTVEHLIPVSLTEGWSDEEKRAVLHDPQYLVPAHMACNSARGNKPYKRQRPTSRPTRDWGA